MDDRARLYLTSDNDMKDAWKERYCIEFRWHEESERLWWSWYAAAEMQVDFDASWPTSNVEPTTHAL
jgi:hypothetical protein